MSSILELGEKQKDVMSKAKDLLGKASKEQRTLTPEEYDTHVSYLKELDALGAQINTAHASEQLSIAEEKANRLSERQSSYTSPSKIKRKLDVEEKNQIWRAYAFQDTSNPEITLLAQQHGLPIHISKFEKFGLTTGGAGSGAEFVGTTLIAQVIEKQKEFCDLVGIFSEQSTPNGEDISYPLVDDTENVAVEVSEGGNLSPSMPDPTTDVVTSEVTKYSTQAVKVSKEELTDSRIDIEGLLAVLFAKRLGRKYATVGTAALLDYASAGNALATGNDLTPEKLYEFIGSLDPAFYPQAKLTMGYGTWFDWCVLRDDEGRLVFPNLNDAVVKRLAGFPVQLNSAMTNLAAADPGDAVMTFGDHSAMILRRVQDQEFLRLNELYALTGQVGFIMTERVSFYGRGHGNEIVTCTAYEASSMAAKIK